jgi:hypothetical protein
MNKVAKKPVKKAVKAAKPVKKRSKVSAAVKPVKKVSAAKSVGDDDGWKPEVVPLAEVEVLAAKAVKMIKAKRSASPEEKAKRLRHVEETLEFARNRGALSKCGAWGLKHPFGICKILDWEAVLR